MPFPRAPSRALTRPLARAHGAVIDLDGDGVVSERELAFAVQERMKESLTDDQAATLIRMLDTDKDGSIRISDIDALLEVLGGKKGVADASREE